MSIITPTPAQVEAAQLKSRLLSVQSMVAMQILPSAKKSLAKPEVLTALGADAADVQAIVDALEVIAP